MVSNVSICTHIQKFNSPYQPQLEQIQKHLLDHKAEIEAWFRTQWDKTPPPFYSSVDIRNAGFKLSPIDTNLFPAGFNNLDISDLSIYVQAVQATIAEFAINVTQLAIIPESHSRNTFYFESLSVLQEILQESGLIVRIGSLDPTISKPTQKKLSSGKSITLEPLIRSGNQISVGRNFIPECFILNNDLSNEVPDILNNIPQPILPSPNLGWANRLKSKHFNTYAEVAKAFSEAIKIDPWFISPLFNQCPDVNFLKKEGVTCLMNNAAILIEQIKEKYKTYKIKEQPFLIVKADAGSYGMGVMSIQDPEEILHLNRKQRTRMSISKGNVPITKVILQEGVFTFEKTQEEAFAEPVTYLFGRWVIGGFYRVHASRGYNENLNAPGMNFIPVAFQGGCQSPLQHSRLYIYGIIARLAALAAAREFASLPGDK